MPYTSIESNFEDLQKKLESILDFTSLEKEPTLEEITSFEHVLKELFSSKRKKLSEIHALLKIESLSSSEHSLLTNCFKQLKNDLLNFCLDVVDLLGTQILPKLKSASSRVFFLKIKGDFHRYSAELYKQEEEFYARAFNEGMKAYKAAYEIAKVELSCESLVYLNLCLNFSVFYYSVAKDTEKACEIVSETLKKLKHEMDAIPEELQKGLQATKCLLENNLILWTAELEEQQEVCY